MNKHLVFAVLSSTLFLFAQGQGMTFEHHQTWPEILQKAKIENKYIFVDCYASWCGPCKWMDNHVYVNDTVGDLMNKDFIAVKLQMDTTRHDDDETKRWYESAHAIGEEYRIRAYPSYLFFSSDGRVIHKGVGATDVQGFVTLVKLSMDSKRQFYTLLSQYQQGYKDFGMMPYVANTARSIGEDSLSLLIANDYIYNYLGGLPLATLWTRENIEFINDYSTIFHSGDPIFHRYFVDRKKIDSIMDRMGYADRLINFIVYKEDVQSFVNSGVNAGIEPDWRGMKSSIAAKYGNEYIEKNVLKGRVVYYRARKQWKNYTKYFVRQMEMANIQTWPAGLQNIIILNNDAFEIFKYSKSKKELEGALTWIDKALSMESMPGASEMDTKANLLYKLGRKMEGLALEEQCRNLDPNDKEIEESYAKMKNGMPTW